MMAGGLTRRLGGRALALVLAAGVVVGGGAVAQAGPPEPGTGPRAPADRHRCAEATSRCDGTIEVPLDWSDPGSERIEVAFAFVPRSDRSQPAAGTVLANLGGPGPAIPTLSLIQQALGPVLDRHNLLMVDPRGLGKSSPLRCPGIDVRVPEKVAQCARQLGPKVQFFTADQHAADLDAVRQALGIDSVTFYGNSYGTVFAQAYVTRYPDRVDAVFLDSVAGIDDDGYSGGGVVVSSLIRAAIGMHDTVCDASPACQRIPGDTQDRLGELLTRLRERPDPAVSPQDVFWLLSSSADATVQRELAAAVASYLDGDPRPLRRLAGMRPPGAIDTTQPERAGILAYECGDAAYAYDRDADPAERRRQLDRHYAEEWPFAPFTAEEVLSGELAGLDGAEQCVGWPTPRESPVVEDAAEYPDVPVLVVNGELDPATTPDNAAAVAGRFPQASLHVIRFGSHASALGGNGPYSECVQAMMRDFVADPRHPVPDPGCSAENYRALGAFPVTAAGVAPVTGGDLHADEERLVAAAFATAQDAASRRNPYTRWAGELTEEPGLRGGTVSFDDEAGTITLQDVRYVEDLTVTGTIRLSGGTAAADLRLGGAGAAVLRLTWQPYQAADHTRISGELDGRPFDARVDLG